MTGGSQGWRPRRVLVGYDGTEGGRDAVALAKGLAEPDAEFLVVDVIPPVAFTMRPRRLEGEEPPQSQGFFLEALRGLSGRQVETRTYVANSAAHMLTEILDEKGFDLVTIGPCYPGIVGRILLGSVGAGLIHGAAAPVAAAPRGYAGHLGGPIELIAVTWDGSPEARAALVHAEALARREGARLCLLTVDVRQTTVPAVIGWEPLAPKSPDEVLAEGIGAVSSGIEAEGTCLDGGSIADHCEQGVDLLVVGSPGYGALGRVLAGSVATGLLHHATCPVLTVPRPRMAIDESNSWTRSAAATE
ncbi:MAG: universal stress protein [Solirubrobacterales bacterium]